MTEIKAILFTQYEKDMDGNNFSIGDEVENDEGTVNGVVISIIGNMVEFVDENYTHYRMQKTSVRTSNYMTPEEKSNVFNFSIKNKGAQKP